jgi:arylsulfatase A-like enzyme
MLSPHLPFQRSLSRRDFLRLSAAGTAALAMGNPALLATPPQLRPNIVLILADDLGFADLGCYGSEIQTPHLDALAQRGAKFSQAYTCPRCCPSRAALLTGLPPHLAGMGFMVSHASPPQSNPTAYQGFLRSDRLTLAEALRKQGYRTCLSGKWHVGEHRPNWPCDRGFDHSWGLLGGACCYFDPLGNRAQARVRRLFQNDRLIESLPLDPEFYFTDAIVDHALEQIAPHPHDDRPFFLYLSFTAPHWPLHARREDIEIYRHRYRHGWDALRRERHQRQIELGLIDPACGLAPREDEVGPWHAETAPAEMAHKMSVYAAQIHRMDQQIGRLTASLQQQGRLEDTLFVFLSDNGGDRSHPPVVDDRYRIYDPTTLGGPQSYTSYGPGWAQASNTPFRRYKRFAHEGGIATPLILAGPGFDATPGWRADATSLLDIVPTCLTAAGAPSAPAPAAWTTRALQTTGRHDDFRFGWEHMGNRAYRWGDYKLVGGHNEPWELYNLAADRIESHDLAPHEPQRLQHMVAAYEAWAGTNEVLDWPVDLEGEFG